MTEDSKNWNKTLGSNGGGGGGGGTNFIKKPGKGWLHTDDTIQDGITYNVKYIGCIVINESMKSLSFEVRTQVARESIRRVAESAKLLNLPRRNRRNDDQLSRILSNTTITQWSGMNVELHINTQLLKVTQKQCNDVLFTHTMQNISFACGGDTDIQDFVAYVAKDEENGRACYVFECSDSTANSVITTIGQAFELRFRKFLSSMPTMKSNTSKPISSPTKSNHLENKDTNKQISSNHHQNNFNHLDLQNQHNNDILLKSNHANKLDIPTKKFNPTEQINTQTRKPMNTPVSTNIMTPVLNEKHQFNGKIDEKLEKMPWFHGLLTRDNAEKLLVRDGDYLVRETNKADRQYVLSGRYKGECRHIFLVDPSGVVRTKDRVFDNICHLIQYHQDNNIPIISKDNELLLEHPVSK